MIGYNLFFFEQSSGKMTNHLNKFIVRANNMFHVILEPNIESDGHGECLHS